MKAKKKDFDPMRHLHPAELASIRGECPCQKKGNATYREMQSAFLEAIRQVDAAHVRIAELERKIEDLRRTRRELIGSRPSVI